MLLGIDEAGRGPFIGPLVMCAVLMDSKNDVILKNLGIKDSKLLSKSKREEFYKILKEKKLIIDYKIIKLQANEVDKSLLSVNDNLNNLELKTSVKLIKFFMKKYTLDKVFLDCPSINASKYKKDLFDKVNFKNLVVEHKADQKYVCVSCASVLAKVTRDKEISLLQKKYLKTIYGNLGSGYPSDVLSVEFLKKNYKKLSSDDKLFRKTWKTYTNFVNQSKQKKLGDY